MVDVVARVRADFDPAQADMEAIFLYGSHATGAAHGASDVDVCVVAGPGRDPALALRAVYAHAALGATPHDVRVFEDMPDWLRGQVLDAGVLVWARDEARLSEYPPAVPEGVGRPASPERPHRGRRAPPARSPSALLGLTPGTFHPAVQASRRASTVR
ncbi:MAG TPA: nucleotidyltransferase domain-containing protein [Candidatus Thermoplasmatota archaeon]|nr:nucleotidyltransferase domain-containing protein [Candidatus Thermoplasmatota archaeon]